MDFFTRIDCMDLTPGNKSAGFFLAVSVPALQLLRTVAVAEEEMQRLLAAARTRVRNSGLVSEEAAEDCGFELLAGSAVPKHFWVNKMFAASIGAQPSELADISDAERARGLGPEISYTPHNVDAPSHALVLMILAQTWSEWARDRLMLAQATQSRKEGV